MNSKAIAAIVAVVVIVVAVGAAVAMSGSNNDSPTETGNTYYGNGGTFDNGKTSTKLTNSSAPTNFFTYSGHTFTGWNTAADGSGTSYAVGAALPSTTGMSLYAQWSSGPYMITSCIVSTADDTTVTLDGTTPTTGVNVNAGSNTLYITNSYTLTFDSSTNTFSYVNGHNATITITVSITGGVDSINCSLVDGVATVTFNVTGDISLNVGYTASR